jgi:hypothetical protein
MTQYFETQTHPKYLVNNICTVCSRIIVTNILDEITSWFPTHYLYRYHKLLLYTNLSYHNIFECNELFNYVGHQSILSNCVLNKNGFDTETDQVTFELYFCCLFYCNSEKLVFSQFAKNKRKPSKIKSF